MTELISDGGQTWAVPAIADALCDMFKKDPNWSLFHDGGHERFSDGQDDDRVCPDISRSATSNTLSIARSSSGIRCAGG